MVDSEITNLVWNDKYRYGNEETPTDSMGRVVKGVYANESHGNYADEALRSMLVLDWCPGGRIHAGAGTPKRVTWINCYVSPDIDDSMEGIMDALKVAALTQQQGGGIGMNFSTLRPAGAIVHRTGSVSSGVIHFMEMWNGMCGAIKSSGSRRGAMMATLADWHPDIEHFIKAKHEKGKLTNFNVSVMVSDAFMQAVKEDGEWELGFTVPPADGSHVRVKPARNSDWYVYKVVKARELWESMTRSTYEYAEPGVLFIDRVNEWNNLYYCEMISCTNPCGEQPLPPNGDCNLGAVNLAVMVDNPFTVDAEVNFEKLIHTVQIGMRFLDNVLDLSPFPTKEQQAEALAKRRTGLGITGLGNMLQQLMVRYGSASSVDITGNVMKTIAYIAYRASIQLAKERGSFPMLDKDLFLASKFVRTLPEDIRDGIREHGIRNAVLLTIAPTGTTSIYYGNISSGIEPTFAWKYDRKVLMPDNSLKSFEVQDYGYAKFVEKFGAINIHPLPPFMVTANELTVDEHLAIQAVCQKYVDASISKTINCPKSMPFDEFQAVYTKAYSLGLKGCTTYRPSDVRGSILSVKEAPTPQPATSRPAKLTGSTYKLRWPGLDQAFYITINDIDRDGKLWPFEIFINSKSVKHQEWITALTRMMSAVFRKSDDPTFMIEELEQVYSPTGGQFKDGEYVPSLVAMIGKTMEQHFREIGLLMPAVGGSVLSTERSLPFPLTQLGEICPQCNQPTLYHKEGCSSCQCGYSNCG